MEFCGLDLFRVGYGNWRDLVDTAVNLLVP